MSRKKSTQACARPWVEWFARRIDDPVARLKFLRAVTPLAVPGRRRRQWLYISRLGLAGLILAALLAAFFLAHASARVKTVDAAAPRPRHTVELSPPPSAVWLVDKSADSESFSNGLRVDTRWEAPNHRRSYLVFPVDRPDAAGTPQSQPAGIVFHTTESHQAPFEASQNGALKQIGESLLEFVRRQHAYHFLIDRFGRVYRIVPEADAANHAGYSVWSDSDWLYLNLNESFLGVSFETQTEPGQQQATVSPAQIHSAAMLTEMLRDRYGIAPGNCVTHAQVSVNPENMRVGYHTDWASSFPFAELGLPDNYARPLPALTISGFQYDAVFLRWGGTRIQAGVDLAEQELGRRAAERGISTVALRKLLQRRYRRQLAEIRSRNTGPEAFASPDPSR
jgi:hypothetical protein